MINFFRKIRRNLLNEGKTTRYFKYAIGEILLVVIGILIALQINTWNESRKQYLADVEFLKYIKSELSQDITALSNKKNRFSKTDKHLEKTIQLFKNNTSVNKQEREFISIAINNLEVLSPVNKNIQRNNIKLANGSLLRIDKTINKNYIGYLETTNYNNNIITKLGETLQNISIQDVAPKFDIETRSDTTIYHFDFIEIKDDRLIKNAIGKSLRFRSVAISFIDSQTKLAKSLIIDIDKILVRYNRKEHD